MYPSLAVVADCRAKLAHRAHPTRSIAVQANNVASPNCHDVDLSDCVGIRIHLDGSQRFREVWEHATKILSCCWPSMLPAFTGLGLVRLQVFQAELICANWRMLVKKPEVIEQGIERRRLSNQQVLLSNPFPCHSICRSSRSSATSCVFPRSGEVCVDNGRIGKSVCLGLRFPMLTPAVYHVRFSSLNDRLPCVETLPMTA
jgi:hypothetical protein